MKWTLSPVLLHIPILCTSLAQARCVWGCPVAYSCASSSHWISNAVHFYCESKRLKLSVPGGAQLRRAVLHFGAMFNYGFAPFGISPYITEVWSWNFNVEFANLVAVATQSSLGKVLAIDFEFPGFINQVSMHASRETTYPTLRDNVDSMKPIQLGVAVADVNGTPLGVWCFNFHFNALFDVHSITSLNFLCAAGLDFAQHSIHGIPFQWFGQYLAMSPLLRNDNFCWVVFSGFYDWAYMLKIIGCGNWLPRSLADFDAKLHELCPCKLDLRGVEPTGSLAWLAKKYGVDHHGYAHTGGSDALLTLELLFLAAKANPNPQKTVAGESMFEFAPPPGLSPPPKVKRWNKIPLETQPICQPPAESSTKSIEPIEPVALLRANEAVRKALSHFHSGAGSSSDPIFLPLPSSSSELGGLGMKYASVAGQNVTSSTSAGEDSVGAMVADPGPSAAMSEARDFTGDGLLPLLEHKVASAIKHIELVVSAIRHVEQVDSLDGAIGQQQIDQHLARHALSRALKCLETIQCSPATVASSVAANALDYVDEVAATKVALAEVRFVLRDVQDVVILCCCRGTDPHDADAWVVLRPRLNQAFGRNLEWKSQKNGNELASRLGNAFYHLFEQRLSRTRARRRRPNTMQVVGRGGEQALVETLDTDVRLTESHEENLVENDGCADADDDGGVDDEV